MKTAKLIMILPVLALLYSCEPKPLDIEVKQTPPRLTVSSAAIDDHTVFVAASYSINSLTGVEDSMNKKKQLPHEMLLKSGMITLTSGGRAADTLYNIATGIYSNKTLQLKVGTAYTLNVYDGSKGLIGIATTTYYPMPEVEELEPEVKRAPGDTSVHLKMKIKNVSAGDYYFVSYYASNNVRTQEPITQENWQETMAAYSPRRLFLLSAADMKGGCIDKTVQLDCKADDDLLVHVGQIDKAYYEYLTAYKKAGSYINQVTGEPINLPSNVVKGLGFFSLSVPVRAIFQLGEKN